MYDHPAIDLIVHALKTVRRREGADAAVADAEIMISAAAGIIARERGVERAHAVLERAGEAPSIMFRN
jgi:hypothetical protein